MKKEAINASETLVHLLFDINQPTTYLSSIYLSTYLSIYLPTFPPTYTNLQGYARYWLSVALRHTCRFTASSNDRLFCFITHSTSLSHFISVFFFFFFFPATRSILASVICYLPCVKLYPYEFNVLFPILSRTVSVISSFFSIYIFSYLQYFACFCSCSPKPHFRTSRFVQSIFH